MYKCMHVVFTLCVGVRVHEIVCSDFECIHVRTKYSVCVYDTYVHSMCIYSIRIYR